MRSDKCRSGFTLLAVVALASAAFLGIACGDDDGDGGATPTAQATRTQPASTPTEAADETPTAGATEPADGEGATIQIAEDPELGQILVDADGFTLYTFGNDTAGSGTSACVDGCAQAWPPLTVDGEPAAGEGVTGELDTIERNDGTTQVTYDGFPLYRYAGDAAPGDTNGHNVGQIWFVAKP